MYHDLSTTTSITAPRPIRRCFPRALLIGVACLVATTTANRAFADKFQYSLYEPIKPNVFGSCPPASNDLDNDCLSDSMENSLATIVAPYYLWDEGDECNYFAAQNSFNQQHFKPHWFHQVRPALGPVNRWTSSSTEKFIRITYFFNYPEDCAGFLMGGGHMGDGERVVFVMKSTDLVNWIVDSGEYYFHSSSRVIDGDFIKAIATSVNASYPLVLAGEDAHASYWGHSAGSEDCCNTSDCSGDSCLQGSLATSKANGTWVFPLPSLNIGGPSPENWNFNVLGNDNGVPFSAPDVGHGFAPDYWAHYPPNPSFSAKFCGFSCTTVHSDGNCAYETHGNSDCTSPLQTKVNSVFFWK
jgi:hypothetical protein